MKVILRQSLFLVVLISCQDIIEDESFNYREGQFPKRAQWNQENRSLTDAINTSRDFLNDSDYFQWLANILDKDQISYDYMNYEAEDKHLLKTAIDDTEKDVSTAALQDPLEEGFQTFNVSSPSSDVEINTENSYIGSKKNNATEDTTTRTGLNKTESLLNLQKQQLEQNSFSKEHRKNNGSKEKLTEESADYDNLSSTVETTSPGRTQAVSLSHFKERTPKKTDTSVLPDSREIAMLSYFITYFEEVLLQEDAEKTAHLATSSLSYLNETSAQVETKSSQENSAQAETKSSQETSTHESSQSLAPTFSETKRGTTETTAKEDTVTYVPSYSKAKIAKNTQSSILKETTNKRFTETKKPHSDDRTSGYSKSMLSIFSYSEESTTPKNIQSSILKETTKKEFTKTKKPNFDKISEYSKSWHSIFPFSAEYGTHERMSYSDEQNAPYTSIKSPASYSKEGTTHQGTSSVTLPYSEEVTPQDLPNITSTQHPTLLFPEVVDTQEPTVISGFLTSDKVIQESIESTTRTTKATKSPRLPHSNITTVQGSTNTLKTSRNQTGGIPLTYSKESMKQEATYSKESMKQEATTFRFTYNDAQETTSTSALPFSEAITEDNVMNNFTPRFLEGTTSAEDRDVLPVTTNFTRNESESLFPVFSLATTGNQTSGHCLVIISLIGVQLLMISSYNTLEIICRLWKGSGVLGKIICISVFLIAKLMLMFAYLAVQHFTGTGITVVNRT